MQESVPGRPRGCTHPFWAQNPRRHRKPGGEAGIGLRSPGEPSGLGAARGPRARDTIRPKPSGAGPAGCREDAAPPHTCGSLPRAPTRLGRRSRAALGRCGAARCPRLRRARPPSPRSRPNGVTCAGPGTTRAGGGCAEPESAAGLTGVWASAWPEGCAGRSHARDARGSRARLEEPSPRLAPPPRPPGLRARVTAERLLKGAAAARTPAGWLAGARPGSDPRPSGRGPRPRGAHPGRPDLSPGLGSGRRAAEGSRGNAPRPGCRGAGVRFAGLPGGPETSQVGRSVWSRPRGGQRPGLPRSRKPFDGESCLKCLHAVQRIGMI